MTLRGISILLLAGLLPMTAMAQDEGNPEDEPRVEEKRVGVIILEQSDGEGPVERQVIILEGDDLDLDVLPHFGDMQGVRQRFKLSDGDFEFEFDFTSEGGDEPSEHMQKLRKKIFQALSGPDGIKGLFANPEKRGKWIEEIKKQALEGTKRTREAWAKRTREEMLEALDLGVEAAAVVVPLLDALLKTQDRITRADKKRRAGLLKKAKDGAEFETLLGAFREATQKDRQTLKDARQKLRDLLTLGQEIELVLRGVLD